MESEVEVQKALVESLSHPQASTPTGHKRARGGSEHEAPLAGPSRSSTGEPSRKRCREDVQVGGDQERHVLGSRPESEGGDGDHEGTSCPLCAVDEDGGPQPFILRLSDPKAITDHLRGHYKMLGVPVKSKSKDKHRCLWPGCDSELVWDGISRHVQENHMGRKIACKGCDAMLTRGMRKRHKCQVSSFPCCRST